MVFNILSNNTDDHNKNFSFIMDENGSWRLSPAYDVTYIFDRGGFLPNEEHCMFVRAKLRDISRSDVVEFARDNGIRRPDETIRCVVNSLKRFRPVAVKHGVADEWIGRVEKTLIDNLKSWGEWDDKSQFSTAEINGHVVENMRIEETYKGNYHLYANIDGKERKFVVSKNKDEFSLIKETGLANLTNDQLKAMIIKYFKI